MNRYAQQSGGILVVALIFLMILAVLAVSGLSTALVQEKMSGHLLNNQLAFQSANAALRDAELWLQSQKEFTIIAHSQGRWGVYDNDNWGDPENAHWDEHASVYGTDPETKDTFYNYSSLETPPKFLIIEKPASFSKAKCGGKNACANTACAVDYLISARGQAGSAKVDLSSTYRMCFKTYYNPVAQITQACNCLKADDDGQKSWQQINLVRKKP
ncbi:MAG: hypothetical protein KZQ58_06185 [gamma proteobacterium symbiont of Bathyaustriella thionipta]|nr:hypothetical protein [gamma proteobacterium symbiont of Bathyaustriella thionipta]